MDKLKRLFERWAMKLGGAIFDQVFFSGSNFVLNILLARWMLPEEYGGFAVAYAWFLLALNLYEAIITEPMNVFGAGKYWAHFSKYLGIIYRGHIVLSLFIALLLAIGAVITYFTDSSIVAAVLLGSAVAAPFLLARWLTRFPFYVLGTPHVSVVGSIIYLIFAGIGYVVFHEMDLLTPVVAILWMGISGFAGSIVQTYLFLKPNWQYKDTDMTIKDVVVTHWDYGKWSTLTRVMNWIPSNVYTVVMPIFISLAGSAALRAVNNLVLPIALAISALSSILLPAFVRTYENKGIHELTNLMRNIMILYTSLTFTYLVVIVIGGQWIFDLVYDGQYNDFITIPILIALGLNPMIAGISAILDISLRAMGNIKKSFLAKIIPTAFTLTGGIFLLAIGGLLGSYIATIIANLITIFVLLIYFVRSKQDIEANRIVQSTAPTPTS